MLGHVRAVPRFWPRSENSVEAWLTDQIWIKQQVKQAGSDDGTPRYNLVEYGPYAGKLAAPISSEEHQRDREVLEVSHTLAVASDIRPRERDSIRVRLGHG